MAFVVEDGTGKPDANSYGAVADADVYFADRGVVDWTGDDSTKQGALVRATDYIEERFYGNFAGQATTDVQALSWPRQYAFNFGKNEIPATLKKACFEYALRALTQVLAPDLVLDGGFARVKTEETIGPMTDKFAVPSKGPGSDVMLIVPYPAADMLMRPLLVYSDRVIR